MGLTGAPLPAAPGDASGANSSPSRVSSSSEMPTGTSMTYSALPPLPPLRDVPAA